MADLHSIVHETFKLKNKLHLEVQSLQLTVDLIMFSEWFLIVINNY